MPGIDLASVWSPRLVRLGAAAAGISLTGWLLGWLPTDRAWLLATLLTAAAAFSAVPAKRATVTPPLPAFVVGAAALLLLGPLPAVAVAAVAAYSHWRTYCDRHGDPDRRGLASATASVASMQAASFVFDASSAWLGTPSWPMRSLPTALAVTVYVAIVIAARQFLAPPSAGRSMVALSSVASRAWGDYVMAAGVGAALAELLARRSWGLLLMTLVPLAILYRRYQEHEGVVDVTQRRDEVVDVLGHGRTQVGADGRILSWSDQAARMTACAPERALGASLVAAVPAFAHTRVPQAVCDAITHRRTDSLPSIVVPTSAGARIVDVTILPDEASATLVMVDVTDRVVAEQQSRRCDERMALIAEGATEGLWEWDLRTQILYLSGPWNAMLGLPPTPTTGPADMWFARVHADDATPLKERLEAHLVGQTAHFTHEHRLRHEDGTYRHVVCRGVSVRGTGRRAIRLGGSMAEVSSRTRAVGDVQRTIQRDPLTGLANRTVFVESLGRRLQDFKLRRGAPFAALYLDLDRFKVVNDSLGHLVGDELLTAVSRRLEGCLREGDELARLGGDEFAILLSGLGDGGQANAIAFRIQEALSAPLSIGGREVFTSASIGIAFSRLEYDNPEEMMRDADTAMYHAKAHGKARHELFDADMHARAQDRLGFENDLRHAVKANAFDVNYQPIVSLATGRCVGFEALVRWQRDGQAVSPATFVPVAEELGIIEQLGTFVLQEACRRFADWQIRFPDAMLEYITVNVSTRQLMQQGFLHVVEQAVTSAGLRPADLRLEITETTLMDNPLVAADALRELRNFGVKIYLDDFGTGYSSLSHLHKLPVDALKIDRSFVRSLLLPDRPAIVESILALARTLDTGVVAEGVESEVQATELERLGCRHAQGYLFSRPLSAQAVEQMLLAGIPLGDLAARFSPQAAVGDTPSAARPWRFDSETAPVGRVASAPELERPSDDVTAPALAGSGGRK